MVGLDDGLKLKDLRTWQDALKRQAQNLRVEIRGKQSELSQVEERLTLVTKLVEIEQRPQEKSGDAALATTSTGQNAGVQPSTLDLEDAVQEILRSAGEPLHISTIRERLIAGGVPIPGRGDEANVIVRLRRLKDRFTRTARGTYSLTEWGLPELTSKSRKRRRSAP